MSAATNIEWTDRTWNPTRGCSRVSAGCDHCYAIRQARRQDRPGGAYEGLTRARTRVDWSGIVDTVPEKIEEPLRWRKPQRVFVDSMSDLFHESLPWAQIERIFEVMAEAERHTFQVLTKRPENMCQFMERWAFYHEGPPPNVWLGVSVEDQKTADERIPILLRTPAAVRFVSYEPALGPVDFGRFMCVTGRCPHCDHADEDHADYGRSVGCQAGVGTEENPICGCRRLRGEGVHEMGMSMAPHRLSWLIVGGESGPGARPCDVAWIRSAVEQCRAAGVPVFVKQLGARPLDSTEDAWERQLPRRPIYGPDGSDQTHDEPRLANRKGGDPEEWPEDLRIREFPR